GTSLLRVQTTALPTPAAAAGTAVLAVAPPSTPATLKSPREGTRVLSIGLHAEAAPAVTTALQAIDARLEGMGRSFPITRPTFSIGRNRDADVPIDHDTVATLHAQIERHGDTLYLRDAGSRTGTWVNRRLLTAAHALADGDRIQVGPTELVLRAPSLRRAAAEAAPTVAELCLEVRSGQSVGLSFALRGDALLIGSQPGAAVELRDLSVAPQHARLRKAGAQLFVADLGSGRGTFVQQGALQPGQEVPLAEGGWFRVGTVDLALVRGATIAAAALRPRARLRVDSGPGAGSSLGISEGALVGSGPQATLSIPGLAPVHLEIVLHGQSFWARDRSGGSSFRSGSPLGAEFVELSHGDALLLGGGTMLRFEETP
ncbi:MAG TPA: FHA domain-containing protein, partial [Polyangiaceae bacterium]